MKPKLAEFILASRYTLPFWVLVWLFLYDRVVPLWSSLDENVRLALVFFAVTWVLAWLKALPKVWRYEHAKRKHAAAGRDPEQIRQQYRNRQRQFLLLLAIGGWGYSLYWLSENSYADNPTDYLTALAVCAGLTIAAAITLYFRVPFPIRQRVGKALTPAEKPFAVSWCQPVPKHTPSLTDIQAGLPDYCQIALSEGTRRPT